MPNMSVRSVSHVRLYTLVTSLKTDFASSGGTQFYPWLTDSFIHTCVSLSGRSLGIEPGLGLGLGLELGLRLRLELGREIGIGIGTWLGLGLGLRSRIRVRAMIRV